MTFVADSQRTHEARTYAVLASYLSLVRKEAFDELQSTSAVDAKIDEQWKGMPMVYTSLCQNWVLQDNDWLLPHETQRSPKYIESSVNVFRPSWLRIPWATTVSVGAETSAVAEFFVEAGQQFVQSEVPTSEANQSFPWLQLIETEEQSAWIDSEGQRFGYSLIDLLTTQPVDEGYEHPGEQLIADSLLSKPSIAPAWIQRVYLEKERSNPVLAGEILKCISQLASLDDPEWAIILASRGLDSPEIQLREAAVRVFESWGDTESSDRLTGYISKETVSWLSDYALEVLEVMGSQL